MRTLYIDCGMGAAGDMLTAALVELFDDREKIVRELNSLHIPHVFYEAGSALKCGITGTHMKVSVDGVEEDEHMHEHHHHDHEHEHDHHEHHHHHSSMHDIEHIVRDHINLEAKVADDVMAVYGLIAEAESLAHGKSISEIHFHEVGTMDAVADVTAVCYLLDKLKIDRIVASPVCVGSGKVRCAHGILPVPAPATAHILQGVPTYAGNIASELCTPTGAALLKHFVDSFESQPVMSVDKIGYGMGKKDFEVANCVRVMLGESENKGDEVVMLDCNVDDMTGEEIGFAFEMLFEKGALDVFTTPIGMKKNRPGLLLSVLCKPSDRDEILRTIFKYTSTIGIRETLKKRYILDRTIEQVETSYGLLNKKVVSGYGVRREKFEYEDLASIAREKGISIDQLKKDL